MARRRDFEAIYREGDKLIDRRIVLFVRREDAPDAPTRIGLSVGRRVGNAVARNRVKRVLREAFRHALPHWPAGLALVVVARPGSAPTTRAEAAKSLERLMRRWQAGPLRPRRADAGRRGGRDGRGRDPARPAPSDHGPAPDGAAP